MMILTALGVVGVLMLAFGLALCRVGAREDALREQLLRELEEESK
jgi:multisubunit Na+/H+ antiporter MnhC subunit